MQTGQTVTTPPAQGSAEPDYFDDDPTPVDVAAPYRVVPLRWVVALLLFGTVLALWSLWVPLVLAAWGTFLARPLHERLARRLGGSGRAAGVVTVALVLVLLGPVVTLGLSIAGAVADLVSQMRRASGVREAIGTLLSGGDGTAASHGLQQQLFELMERHGGGAVSAIETVFGALTTFGIFVVVFVFGFYTFLVHGKHGWRWFLAHAPVRLGYMTRLAAAFEETGRGLVIGFGLTSLLQGAVAALAYAVIGVPQALMLGVLTAFSAFIPMVGTGLVWGPVTVALLLTERTGAAIAVLIMGVLVGSLDNLVRPALARHGRLELPTFVVLVSMLGGVMMFGAAGLLLGPLCVRLLVEALRMSRDARLQKEARG